MSATPAEPTTPAAPAMEPPVATATPPAPTPAEPVKAPTPTTNPWDDPKAAEAEIKRLRSENGSERVNAKAQAAEDARKELAQTIGKALGLVEDETIDPVKLTESLTTSQAEAKQARVELAIFRAAAAANGDPGALLDSQSFLKSLANVDPSDTAAVQAAITQAVADNPRLGAAPAEPRPPAPNPAQGSSASGPTAVAQLTRADVERLAAQGKHDDIAAAKAAGQLNSLLGIK